MSLQALVGSASVNMWRILLIVTHNLAQARRIADPDHCGVFWVTDGVGRLIELGATQQVFEAPRDPVTAAYVQGLRG